MAKPPSKPSKDWMAYAEQLEIKLAQCDEARLAAVGRCANLQAALDLRPNPSSVELSLGLADNLIASLPPAPGATRGHSISISLEGAGFVLLRILRAQAAALERRDFTLGHVASPTQDMVKDWLSRNLAKKYNEKGGAVLDTRGIEL